MRSFSFCNKKQMLTAAAAMIAAAVSTAHAAPQLGDVFYIAMENHDFTQGAANPSPQQIFNNPAAPFQNSLITPGNPNAAMVSYASNYTNAGFGVHPSEPNYIWDESGTNYNPANGITNHTDADPSAAAGNIFNIPHLTGLMNSAGVSWKNYQEDYQVSGNGPTKSSSGTLPGGAHNPYYNTGQYNYAVKHNPMAFFPDTATQNVAPISQLTTDLTNNSVSQYNWITPNQFNDAHSALTTDFTYAGQTWEGTSHPGATFAQTDQEAIALGDNFLSILVPQIEASQAFQNNGAIVIWYDETENGDTTTQTIPEIVISPLAKGNAFNSILPYNHSSDLKTLQEVFNVGAGYLNNQIPAAEFSPAGGPGTTNGVAASNDLSDLFQAGVIPTSVPEPSSMALLGVTGLLALKRKRRA